MHFILLLPLLVLYRKITTNSSCNRIHYLLCYCRKFYFLLHLNIFGETSPLIANILWCPNWHQHETFNPLHCLSHLDIGSTQVYIGMFLVECYPTKIPYPKNIPGAAWHVRMQKYITVGHFWCNVQSHSHWFFSDHFLFHLDIVLCLHVVSCMSGGLRLFHWLISQLK